MQLAYMIYDLGDTVMSIDGSPVEKTIAEISTSQPSWGVVYDEEDNPALGTNIEEDATYPVVVIKRALDGEEYTPTEISNEIFAGPRPPKWPWLA